MKNPYFRHIWNMIHKYKYGWLQVITGMPGSGKSWTALTMAEILDNDFSIDRVAFTPTQYLDILSEAKMGDFIVWDEVGIALPARKWYSLSNIMITEVLQTMRYKRLGLIMVVPDLSFIDIQARKLIHCFGETKRYGKDPVKLWIYEIKTDRKEGKLYFVHPRIRMEGTTRILKDVVIHRKPSELLREEYEMKHMKYKKRIETKAMRMASIMDKEELSGQQSIYDVINKVIRNPIKYTNKKGNIDWHLVKLHHDTSRDLSQQVIMFAEKKMRETNATKSAKEKVI